MKHFLIAASSLCCLAPMTAAQGVLPDVHWGAYSIPSPTPELRVGLHFNRFTQFSGTGSQFNEIEETAGFNFLVGSYTDRVPGYPSLTYTSTLGVGLSSDEPTQALQNDFVHELNPQSKVPVGADREEVEFLGSLSVTYWSPKPTNLGTDYFLGGGVGTSTLFHEPWVHAGARFLLADRCRLSFLHRFSRPVEGMAYEELAQTANVSQVYLAYVPSRIESSAWLANFLGNPEFGVAITHDTGLFVDAADSPIDTWYASLRFSWATGLTIETWNDFANGTDFGPSFGFLVSWDVTTLPGGLFDFLR